MKTTLLVLAVSLVSSAAFAAAPSNEMNDLSRILLSNPEIGQKLKPNCADRLVDYQVTQVEAGVQKFELTYLPSGMCLPVKAFVTVIEDIRPTYADGSPVYKTTVEIKPQN